MLPSGEYDEEHLDGAIHLPLEDLGSDTARGLEPSRPVEMVVTTPEGRLLGVVRQS